jgi:hypothetical protein
LRAQALARIEVEAVESFLVPRGRRQNALRLLQPSCSSTLRKT